MSEENAVLELAGLGESEETPAELEPTETEPTEIEDAKGVIEPEPEKEPEVEPPATTEDTPKGVDPQNAAMLAALQDERGKRQDLEKQVLALQQKPAPDPLDDPEGFKTYQQEQFTGLKADFDQQLSNAKYDMARLTVMSLKDDYETVEAVFIEEAKNNPTLARQLAEAPNPALFAYEQGQRIQQLSVDPVTLRETIRLEERAKIEAELKGTTEAAVATQAAVDNALKPSLATAGNAGLQTEAVIDLSTVSEMTGEDATHRKAR